jgi:hypothetical protein
MRGRPALKAPVFVVPQRANGRFRHLAVTPFSIIEWLENVVGMSVKWKFGVNG